MKLLSLSIFLLIGCGASSSALTQEKQTTQENSIPKPKKDAQETSFSIVKYDIDDIEIKERVIPIAVKNKDVQIVSTKGFRLQILALADFTRAKEFEARLKAELGQSEHNVYVDFYSPNYRVRVGDFKTRDDAKKIIPMLKKLGYRDCFIVPDKVTLILNDKPQ
jgi:cell division protein FtsN